MKMIHKRLWLSGFAAGATFLLLIIFVARREYLPAGVALCAAAAGIVFLVRALRFTASAKLIMENRMIGICPAMVSAAEVGGEPVRQVIECVLSPFGLLVGSRVYKFGRDGIRLHAVDIGEARITVVFGNEARRWKAVLLHGPLSEEELELLVQKMEYETGILPSVPSAGHTHQERNLS